MRIFLLLTATIDPSETPRVVRRDVGTRLEDYRSSFRFYGQIAGFERIVVAENSGYPVEELRAMLPETATCEVISVTQLSSEDLARGGQALGEMSLLRAALAQSAALQSADLIVKATGRVPVVNLARIVQGLRRRPVDISCTLRKNLSVTHSVCFAATPRFFRDYLFPRESRIDETTGTIFETVLNEAVLTAIADGLSWQPMPLRPHVVGIRAADGCPYQYSWFEERARDLRHSVLRWSMRA